MISRYGALGSHSLGTQHSVGLLWTSEQPTQRPLPDITQELQQQDFHDPVVIGTHNSSEREAADPRLRPRGHWVRQYVDMVTDKRQQTIISWN